MPWTVAWWVGGVAGGLVALWLLAAAAGIDRPRRWLRGRGHALACGACGHAAVTPDTIATCPECGAGYAQAGLLTPKAGLRYGPPPWVVALLLLAGVAIGSALLAPVAGKAANRRAIGAPQVEEARIHNSYQPPSGYALAIYQEQLRAQQSGTWSQHPPVLEGTVRVELTVGATLASGSNPPGSAQVPRLNLQLPTEGDRWTITDAAGTEVATGQGSASGVARLFEAGGLDPTSPIAAVTEDELAAIAELVQAFHGAKSGPVQGLAAIVPRTGLSPRGTGISMLGYHTFHRASPWGIAAGVATPAGLVVVAGVLLLAIAWSRRRMRAGGGRHG